MPVDRSAEMEEKLRILEDLNMIYIRQIALSLQPEFPLSRETARLRHLRRASSQLRLRACRETGLWNAGDTQVMRNLVWSPHVQVFNVS
ncbi:hypothetical protein AAFF_G00086300 [Aldrovandia affinis]|uniref:Uncharacterized protein n=1 Tax=Aldrovandia affinis TaxID=143900 RepID=A0AAD7WCN5_9TELE|nr:hypothetical protein AAFF_G00086300 [Aldrovandia affinis]